MACGDRSPELRAPPLSPSPGRSSRVAARRSTAPGSFRKSRLPEFAAGRVPVRPGAGGAGACALRRVGVCSLRRVERVPPIAPPPVARRALAGTDQPSQGGSARRAGADRTRALLLHPVGPDSARSVRFVPGADVRWGSGRVGALPVIAGWRRGLPARPPTSEPTAARSPRVRRRPAHGRHGASPARCHRRDARPSITQLIPVEFETIYTITTQTAQAA